MDQNDDDFEHEPMGIGAALLLAAIWSAGLFAIVVMTLLMVLS